jgi:hypothetical protein
LDKSGEFFIKEEAKVEGGDVWKEVCGKKNK